MAAAGLFLLLAGCDEQAAPTRQDTCEGGKCETPWDKTEAKCGGKAACLQTAAEAQCKLRREETESGTQPGFVRHAIRWACADVADVDIIGGDSRGQEYCEYYAAVQLPPEDGTTDRGRNRASGPRLPSVKTPGRFFITGSGTSRTRNTVGLAIPLQDSQRDFLTENPNLVVGKCVFTSWHADIQRNFKNCRTGANNAACGRFPVVAEDVLKKFGVPDDATALAEARNKASLPLTATFFRMKEGINSNNAAVDLVAKCLSSPNAALTGERASHFERACMHMFSKFQTHWRRSDPSICAGTMRLAECNCGVDASGDGKLGDGDVLLPLPRNEDSEKTRESLATPMARALVPNTRRGFPLSTWNDDLTKLPSGCKFVTETGEENEDLRTLVACDIKADDVANRAEDLKEFCRTKYAKDVVVHVPIPADKVVCEPRGGPNGTAESCGAQPWVLRAVAR